MSKRNEKKRLRGEIVEGLRRQIAEGEVASGEFLPSERELALQYGVSLRVVRDGLAQIEAEGLISRERGRGTIVRPSHQAAAQLPRQNNIALFFVGQIRDTSTMEYFESFQNAFQSGGFGTVVFTSDNDPAQEARLVGQLVREGIAGIALFSAHAMDSYAHLKAAQEAGVKIVAFDHDFPGFDCNYVGINELDAAYRATSHLLNLGCDDVIYLDSDHNWTSVRDRHKGCMSAISKYPHPVRSRVLKVDPFGDIAAQIAQGLSPLLEDRVGRLGLVAYNDQAAVQAIETMKRSGLSVPEDAAVIGFANDLDGMISGTPLTTMQIPRSEIARSAAYLLMHQIRQPEHKPQKVLMSGSLMIRESCGCYQGARKPVYSPSSY